jgi:hypothetical protein
MQFKMRTNIEDSNVMVEEAIPTATPATNVPIQQRLGAFETQYAIFSAAMDQLRKAAVILDEADLQVKLKWKKHAPKSTPPPDQIKFPEVPRYVTEEVAEMVRREQKKQAELHPKSPLEIEQEERRACARYRRNEEAQEAELLRIYKGVMDGTIDESNETWVAMKELCAMAKLDKPHFPPFIRPIMQQDSGNS